MQPTAATMRQLPDDLNRVGLDDGFEGLFLGRVDEAAGVDDDEVRLICAGRRLGAVGGQFGDVAFGVDGVLVAAECDEVESHRGCSQLFIEASDPPPGPVEGRRNLSHCPWEAEAQVADPPRPFSRCST